MIRVKEAVIVEGKYDKIKLSSLIDATIIETEGFSIFKDKKKLDFIRKLAQTQGIIILTDSDSAGFMIRHYLMGSIDTSLIRNAYIPDVLGRERRKSQPSKEGKVGVEGISKDLILKALERAGATYCDEDHRSVLTDTIPKVTRLDLFEDGIVGRENSNTKKKRLLSALNLPERMSTKALLQAINAFLTVEQYKAIIHTLDNE